MFQKWQASVPIRLSSVVGRNPNREFSNASHFMTSFVRDEKASVGLMFPIFATALIGFIGLAVEFGRRLDYQATLDTAVDSAALAAVQQIQASINAGKSSATAITDAQAVATQVFSANLGSSKSYLGANVTVSLTSSGSNWTATASYTASVPSTIGKLFNTQSYPLQRTITSAIKLGSYLSFYLLLDVSGSMGLPSTNLGQSTLAAVNPDNRTEYPSGCVFACHFPGYSGYALSRNGGRATNPSVTYCPQPDTSACIQLRVDAVAYAVQQLISTAQSVATLPNQFAIGLYPFVANMFAYTPVTTSLSTVSSNAASLTTWLDTGSGSLGSGGTHFETALPQMNTAILNVGDGTSQQSPKPFLFLVTDGAQDTQWYSAGSWWGSNHATTLDETLCSSIKSRGITIAVLYIPYTAIQNPTDFAGGEDYYANDNIPNIPSHLQACASSGFYFTANSPADISQAMLSMFQQSLQSAHITK
jgi:Flp pilus assembly protein TadG/uncharacterized protein YegL